MSAEKIEQINILISGEGGLGAQIIGETLVKAIHSSGKYTSYMPNFGVEQRGGVSLAFLQISNKPIIYPKFESADIIIVMSDRSIPAVEKYIVENTLLIFDSSNIDNEVLQQLRDKVLKSLNLNAKLYATENLSSKVANMIFLGAILKYLPEIKVETVKDLLTKKLQGTKNEQYLDMDFKAIDYGIQLAGINNQEFVGEKRNVIKNKWEDTKKSWERFPKYCKGCTLCITRCPVKALTLSNDIGFLGNPMPKIDIDKCIACEICQNTCPDGAINLDKL